MQLIFQLVYFPNQNILIMKNLIFESTNPPPRLFVFLIFLVFGCESPITEEPLPKNEFGVSFKEGVLQFPSLDTYLNLVETDQEKTKNDFVNFLGVKQDYNSLRKSYFNVKNSKLGRTYS